MSEKQQQRDDAYVVIPELEYSHLYNGQYTQLTDLRKSADPDGQSSTYLCTFQILGGCQGRRTGVGMTTVSKSLILGGWVTKVLKNGDKK